MEHVEAFPHDRPFCEGNTGLKRSAHFQMLVVQHGISHTLGALPPRLQAHHSWTESTLPLDVQIYQRHVRWLQSDLPGPPLISLSSVSNNNVNVGLL